MEIKLKKIMIFNPAITTYNQGDVIIYDSCMKYIKSVVGNDAFIINVGTHLPIKNNYLSMAGKIDYKFLVGTNLLKGKMLLGFRQWNISLKNKKEIFPIVLWGAGWQQYERKTDWYSIKLWKSVLDDHMFHSVRDEYTKKKLNQMGIKNVLNTGCPTMWCLTKEFCENIPAGKSEVAVTTITDYNKNPVNDRIMLETLSEHYKKVFFWPQGIGDLDYLNTLNLYVKGKNNIEVVSPELSVYDNLLKQDDIEYIGTRLHGGIRAMQHKKRTLIIGIDNRAKEMEKDFGLNVLDRENISQLSNYIYNKRPTIVHMPSKTIKQFLDQFK